MLSGAFTANETTTEHRFVRLPCGFILSPRRDAGGRGRIRTFVARKERQIYSLLVLATHPPVPQIRSGRSIMSRKKSSGHNCIVPPKQPEHDRTAVRGTSQCRKGSCRKTPALALLSRGIRPQPCRKSLSLKTLPTAGRLSWRRELNPRPSDYKSDALPTELRQPCSNRAKIS